MEERREFQHEIVVMDENMEFKLFMFEGKDGNYVRQNHWHRPLEIFAVNSGSIEFNLSGKQITVNSGEFVLVNSNEIHGINAENPNETIVLQIPLRVFSNYFTKEQFIWFSHSEKCYDSEIVGMVVEMYRLYQEKALGYELLVKSIFLKLIYTLVSEYRKKTVNEEILQNSKYLKKLGIITDYLEEHYNEDISLEQMAQLFGYAPTYLSRMFNKYAGINYKDYLQNVRLEHSLKELYETDHSITEVALNNGFPNEKAFSKLYKKKYNKLPNEIKKAKKCHSIGK